MAEPRSWGPVNGVLSVLLVVLVLATVFFAVRGTSEEPGTVAAAAMSRQYGAVTAAARQETEAFLTVDYRHLAPSANRVLAGATGQFKREYQEAEVHLRSAARQSKATSKGTVRAVGIGDLDGDSAIVYVAADSTVSNTSTGHKAEPRYYRLQLQMTKVGGTWLTANLQFVS